MATQTTNFKLTKPDKTDHVDVSVLNDNFDIIDRWLKNMGVFTVTFNGNDNDGYTADKTYAEVMEAVEMGCYVVAKVEISGELVGVSVSGVNYLQLIMIAGNTMYFQFAPQTGRIVYNWLFSFHHTGAVSRRLYENRNLPFVNEEYNGYELRVVNGVWEAWNSIPKSVETVMDSAANTVTIASTYDDSTVSESVIVLDDTGYPVSVTTDGVTCEFRWEGFDES